MEELDPTAMMEAFKQRLSMGNPDAAAAASPMAQAAGPAGVAKQATDPLTDQPLTADYMSGGKPGGVGQDGGKVLTTLPDRSGKRMKGSGSTGSGAGLNDMLAAFAKSSEASPDPWQAFSNGLSSGLSGLSESRGAKAKSTQDLIDKRWKQLKEVMEYDRNLRKDAETSRHNRASEANDAISKNAYRDSVGKQGKGKGGLSDIQIDDALARRRTALEKKYSVDDATLTPEERAAKQAQVDAEMKGYEQRYRPKSAGTDNEEDGPDAAGSRFGDSMMGKGLSKAGPVTPPAQSGEIDRARRIKQAQNALSSDAPRDQVFEMAKQYGISPADILGEQSQSAAPSEGAGAPTNDGGSLLQRFLGALTAGGNAGLGGLN